MRQTWKNKKQILDTILAYLVSILTPSFIQDFYLY